MWHWMSKAAALDHVKPTGTKEGRDISHPDKAGSVPVQQTGQGPAAYLVLPWAGCHLAPLHLWVPTISTCATTPASLAWPPAPLWRSCLGGISPLTSQEQNPCIQKHKMLPQCQGTSPPHTSHNTRALWALEVCEEVSGEEQCSRRGAAASAARCSKVSLKQEQSAQISTTSPKVSGRRYFGKACKKWGE